MLQTNVLNEQKRKEIKYFSPGWSLWRHKNMFFPIRIFLCLKMMCHHLAVHCCFGQVLSHSFHDAHPDHVALSPYLVISTPVSYYRVQCCFLIYPSKGFSPPFSLIAGNSRHSATQLRNNEIALNLSPSFHPFFPPLPLSHHLIWLPDIHPVIHQALNQLPSKSLNSVLHLPPLLPPP